MGTLPPDRAAARGHWLRLSLKPGQKFGIDPWLHGIDARARLEAAVRDAGAETVLVTKNPVDEVWTGRPPEPADEAVIQPDLLAGRVPRPPSGRNWRRHWSRRRRMRR